VKPSVAADDCLACFTTLHDGCIKLKIYDMSGRLVSIAFAGELNKGAHRKSINISQLKGGTYFAILETESGQQVEKIVVVR
jgi:hypothetical protein